MLETYMQSINKEILCEKILYLKHEVRYKIFFQSFVSCRPKCFWNDRKNL